MSDGPRSLRPHSVAQSEDVLGAVRDQLTRIKFGSIALTIHDGQVVQLEVTEKRRLFAR